MRRDFSEQAFLPSPGCEARKSTFSQGKSAGSANLLRYSEPVSRRTMPVSLHMILAQFPVAEGS